MADVGRAPRVHVTRPAAVSSYAEPVETSGRTTLRLASVNTASGLDRGTWSIAVERLGDAVAGLDADVVALQEVDYLLERTGTVDQATVIANACSLRTGTSWEHRFAAAVHGAPGDPRTFRSAVATQPDEPSYGIALLSRWEVTAWHELRLPPGRARLPVPLPPGSARRLLWVPDEQRVGLAAVITTPVGPLTVVCTHLSFSPLQAVRQLRRLAAWCGELPRPVVLLGDLNLPGTLPARVTGWPQLVRGATYPSSHPRVQLDHALALGGVRVVAGRTVRVGGTDHRAPVVDLALDR